ncbi:MAG TPA: LysR family transcriptional regulator [Burkholderiaceae bacterium]|nr:LysR family transcriptional regulator [Burkholderiaceae bacterium]
MSILISHFKHAIAFARVAECGGFTAAANRLGISAAAVSKSVSLLEGELGTKLLNRTTRSISLTDEGELLLDNLRAIQLEMETTEGRLVGSNQAPRGKLRIHAPVGMGRMLVTPALLSLTRQYPELSIDADFSDRTPNIAQENFDALIKIGDVPDSRLIARQLFKLRYFTCASPEYLARAGTPGSPQDLSRHNCLAYAQWNTGRYHEWDYEKNGQRYTFVPDGNLNVNHPEAIFDAVLDGAGLARIAGYIASPGIRSGKLKVVLEDWTPPGKPVYMVYLPNRQFSPRIQVLAEALEKSVSTYFEQ